MLATEKGMLGFEAGAVNVFANTGTIGAPTFFVGSDGVGSRTGAGYLRIAPNAGAGRFAITENGTITGVSAALANGSHRRIRARAYVRINSLPNQGIGSALRIFSIGGPFGGQAVMWLRSDGTFGLATNVTGAPSSWSTAALSLSTWYRLILDIDFLAGASTTSMTSSLQVTTDSDTPALDVTLSGSSSFGTTTFAVGAVTFGNNGADFTPAASMDFDDVVWWATDDANAASAIVLPTATKIALVLPTGVAQQDWATGTFAEVDEIPLDTSGGLGDVMSSNLGNGTTVLFTHAGASALGVHAVTAMKVYANIACSQPGTFAVETLINGIAKSRNYTLGYGVAPAVNGASDWSGYSSAVFNTITFGVRKQNGTETTSIGNCFAEILYTPGAPDEIDFGSDAVADGYLSGESIGLSWLEWTHVDAAGAAKTYVWAPVDLPDPTSYFGGFKEGRLESFGEFKRALSDKTGQPESAQFSWRATDTDRLIRGLLAGQATRFFVNRMVAIRMISDADRRTQQTPRLVARGVIRKYKPVSGLEFEFTADDFLASRFSPSSFDKQVPQRTISTADFPDCPSGNRGKPVPVLYGRLSDAGSSSGAPILTGTPAIGAFSDGGYQVAGFGGLTSSVVSSEIGTPVVTAASGGTLSADVPNAQYGVMVSGVDAAGRESDPVPYFSDTAGRTSFASAAATVNGSQKIQVSWNAATGAVKYRVYLGWYYFGARWSQMIETASLSCEFTKGPSWTQYNVTSADITPGATGIPFGFFAYYAVSAVMADGETAMSAIDFGIVRGFRRPLRIEWLPVAGALAYRIYRKPAGGTFDRKWEVTAAVTYFDDDLVDTGVTLITGAPTASGIVPLVHVGSRADGSGFIWQAFLLAGHAVKAIDEVYQNGERVDPGNFGVTFAVPGKTGYSSYFANTGSPQYLDINGHRYTLIFVRGPQADGAVDGSKPLAVNVQGIESTGDGTGTLITDLLQQYKHALINWFLQTYQNGAWLAAPTWPVDAGGTMSQVDEGSFDTATAIAARRITGGYLGAWALGVGEDAITLRDAIARLNVSADVESGFSRNSQFFVSMFDDGAATSSLRSYTQIRDIIADSFDIEDDPDAVENIVVYSYAWNLKTRTFDHALVEVSDTQAITDLQGEQRRSSEQKYYCAANATVAADVAARRLLRKKEPERIVTFDTNLRGLASELGDLITVDHNDGIGSAGWTARPLRVLRHSTNPSRYRVRLEALDVDRILQAAFILGDETAIASSWTTATAANKRYGYLANETTGLLSTGDKGKRLR
jgi:hypothetical protein